MDKVKAMLRADLDGQVALVTGASAGVGRFTALALAKEGVAVGLLARGAGALEQLAAEIAASGGRALALPAGVTDEAAVNEAVAGTARAFGQLDILIANAGMNRSGPVDGYPLADWHEVLGVNLTGLFLCARAAIPHLRASGGGQILAVSSGAGKQGHPNLAAYSAAKFGVIGFMQALAAEIKPDNIRCGVILPGSIRTSFGGRPAAEKTGTPARYLEPDDVARALLHQLQQPPHAWVQELHLWPFG